VLSGYHWRLAIIERNVYAPTYSAFIDPMCPVLPQMRPHLDGHCDNCGARLEGRRRKWCSDTCALALYRAFSEQHDWDSAREAALERDGRKCVRCGLAEELGPLVRNGWGGTTRRSSLSVNHIIPRNGCGYGRGCHHHLDNLETLCWPCHQVETNRQRDERNKQEFERQQALFGNVQGPTLGEIYALVEQAANSR
jgi:5-methylcytosine-specific restriction endonuclease McrA